MIKKEYIHISDEEFVPLKDGIDSEFWGKYEINKLGHIKTLKTGRITKKYYNKCNYTPVKTFRVGNRQESYPIHRLVAKTFLIEEDGKPEVDHINRNTLDFRLSNLRWVSRSENLKNRRPPKKLKSIIYQKLDDLGCTLEEIPACKFKRTEIKHINRSILNNSKAYGFSWKRVDLELEEYLDKYRIDLSEERFTEIPGDPQKRKISENGVVLENEWIYSIGWKDAGGYRKIMIDGHPVFIHRLVYKLFSGDTLTGSDIIDHIDTDSQNNQLSNLRKVDQKGNMNNPVTIEKLSKPVLKYSLEGEFLEEFSSMDSACESIGVKRSNNCIRLCCKGRTSKSHGYIWKFKDKKQ